MSTQGFQRGSKKLLQHNTPYYHGSATKIRGGYLQPYEQFNSVQNKRVVGAFVTTSLSHAKFFAMQKCISGNGMVIHAIDKKTRKERIYFERIRRTILPYFYLYTVYEPINQSFIQDRFDEFYSPDPIKIAKTEKLNTIQEFVKSGYEIYVLDKPLHDANHRRNRNDNFEDQKLMHDAIANGQYHRVDVTKMPIRTEENLFQKIFRKMSENIFAK